MWIILLSLFIRKPHLEMINFISVKRMVDAPLVFILLSELGQPLQSFFGLYRQFTITKAAE